VRSNSAAWCLRTHAPASVKRPERVGLFGVHGVPARPLVDELIRQAPATADGPLRVGVPQLRFTTH
jgi:hypothetical protein